MTENGHDIQTISTKRTDLQTDRVLLLGQLTEGKANPSHFLKTILVSPQVAHLALPHPQADPSQSQMCHFLPTHRPINVIKKVTLTDINFR